MNVLRHAVASHDTILTVVNKNFGMTSVIVASSFPLSTIHGYACGSELKHVRIGSRELFVTRTIESTQEHGESVKAQIVEMRVDSRPKILFFCTTIGNV